MTQKHGNSTPRLAADPAALADRYDVVVVGSGYGGAIIAARLAFAANCARRRLRIALLERGDERPTGCAPESNTALIAQLRTPINPLGFYDVKRFETIDVIVGCGLGGTSLNNMNVAMEPDREVFLQKWPRAFRRQVERTPEGLGGLEEYYGRARRMLDGVPWRDGRDLAKAAAFDEIAAHAGMTGETLDIVVSAEDRMTRYGVQRRACTNCGDCCMGCNVGAKNTLMTNYLPMARHCGAELFTRVEVDRLTDEGTDGYRIHCRVRSGAKGRATTPRSILAKRVVLSAGTLGTTAILLRSRDALDLSNRLGEGFSGNGDNFAVAYNTDRVTDAQGFGTRTGPRSRILAGPSITSVMRFGADQPDLRQRFTVQDLTAPSALVDVFRLALMGLAAVEHPDWHPDRVERWAKDVDWNTDGALNHSLGFLIMAHDASDGRIVLDGDGSVRIDWEGAPLERIYPEIDDILAAAVERIDGTYIPNPRWESRLLGNNLITAHPLGGCATADSPAYGVVDDRGRVFRSDGGVHKGLYVSDGSVIPGALAVNPLLSISMFAERAADGLRRELRLPLYDASTEGDDRSPAPSSDGARRRVPTPEIDAEEAVVATKSSSTPTTSTRTRAKPHAPADGSVGDRVSALRAKAKHDRDAAQDEVWEWIKELGAKHDTAELAELFALGLPPSQLDGPADGILVTTTVNPVFDLSAKLATHVWMPWRGKIFDAERKSGINRLTANSALPARLLWPLYAMRRTGDGLAGFEFVSAQEPGKIKPRIPVLKVDYKPVMRNPNLIIRQIRDELVELVPGTHLGRILFRLPAPRGEHFTNIGYFALRQPAA